jgi:superfamily II DNA or RNA helicase
MKLTFDKGIIQIQGDIRVPNSTWDERSKTFRAMALYYRDIIDFLNRSGFDFDDDVLNLLPCPELQSSVVLRDYQNQALNAWMANGNRGIIVLPTGSGKTLVGIKAISLLITPTLVVAPTLDLVDQWRSRLKKEFRTEVGVLGGGNGTSKP